MRVFLMRHGETEHNRNNAVTGQIDVSLNEYGVKQAEKAAERFENYDFDAFYSSDLERSYQTAKIVSEKHDGLHPDRYKAFRERSLGEYEDRPDREWENVVNEHKGDRIHLSPEEGESLKQAGDRFLGKLEELIDDHQEDDQILVSGHGAVIKSLILEIMDLEGEKYDKLAQDNTGITELDYTEENGWKLVTLNDTAHLEN